jgi:cytochrome c biogenesis protein CcmG/thiol:disulfide interchange protein DsbE
MWTGIGRRRRRLSAWLLALVALAVLLFVGLAPDGGATDRPAPALPRVLLAGRPVTLDSLLGAPGSRHAALVVFWASWCEPCQHEAPAVERFALSPTGRGRIVGVDYGESELALPRSFLRRYHWTFPNLSDPDAHAGEAYGLTGLPSTFVIDARGRIRAALRGPQTVQSLARALDGAEG